MWREARERRSARPPVSGRPLRGGEPNKGVRNSLKLPSPKRSLRSEIHPCAISVTGNHLKSRVGTCHVTSYHFTRTTCYDYLIINIGEIIDGSCKRGLPKSSLISHYAFLGHAFQISKLNRVHQSLHIPPPYSSQLRGFRIRANFYPFICCRAVVDMQFTILLVTLFNRW